MDEIMFRMDNSLLSAAGNVREQNLPVRQAGRDPHGVIWSHGAGRHQSRFETATMAFRGKPSLFRPIEVGAP